jgi:transcriptional regulator with GAF, ATPase, and Fis domain
VAAKPAAAAPAAAAKPATSPRSLEALARALNPDGSPITAAPAAGGGGDAGPFAGTIEKMRTASERDQVVALLLDAMTDLAEVSGLFVLQQKQLACLDGRGADHVVMSMKWFTVAAEEDSPFNDVMSSREPHIGKVPDAKRASLAALGSSEGNLLMVPLVVGQKSIGVLYGDELKRDLKPLAASLKLLTQEAAAAFTRIILQRKKQG